MTENWYELPGNYSNNSEVAGVGDWMTWTNQTIGGGFGAGILLIIFITSFGISMMAGSKKAILASSFITFIFSVYFARLGMVNPVIVFILVIILVISIVASVGDGRGGGL